MLKKINLTIIFICGLLFAINAQSISRNVISASGGTLTSAGNIITYNIGDPVTHTLSAGNNIITQGFEQPGEELHTGTLSTNICAGSNVIIPYTAIDIGGTNVFTAQLSDATGNFASPVTIGTQTGNASGNINASIPSNITTGVDYRIRVISSYPAVTGTDNGMSLTINICGTIVNLKLFLQGYYIGNNSMQPVLNNQGIGAPPNETDTIIVELHDATTHALVDSKQTVLLTNGSVVTNFNQPPGLYFVAIKHRNTIQTWTSIPIACATTTTALYDFTTDAEKAFAANQVLVEPGVWAFYTGDLNQDGFVDGNDFSTFDNDSFNSISFEYVATDINGDGFVDGNDFSIFDNNSFNSVTAIYP